MDKYMQVSDLMERFIHKYNQFEKSMTWNSGNTPLTHGEIHTIACIGDNEGLNLTQLAKIKGITKSAASQVVYRLMDKKMVDKRPSPKSDAEICIYLTESGLSAYKLHNEYHKSKSDIVYQCLKKYPEDVLDMGIKLFTDLDSIMDQLLKDKH